MPGVPSGRACEACRKLKKKCDLTTPSCGRCSRLRIPCVGPGQRRYKFIQERGPRSGTKSESPPASKALVRVPSNELSSVAHAFVSMLQVQDTRYDMNIYGWFLKDVPKRLGTSDALDAAVGAITRALPCIPAKQPSADALEAYGRALRSLRLALGDPGKANSANTLCAMYFVVICQGWLGVGDEVYMGHGQACAHLLSNAATRRPREDFEACMLVTMTVIVILDSVVNRDIKVGPWLQNLVETCEPVRPFPPDQMTTVASLRLHNLAKFTDFVHEPETRYEDIRTTYQEMLDDIPRLYQFLERLRSWTPATPSLELARARYQQTYDMLLSLSVLLNAILRVFCPNDIALVGEAMIFCDELIIRARAQAEFRPFGASYIPICLVTSWVGAIDSAKKAEIEEVMAVYDIFCTSVGWIVYAKWLENKIDCLRVKLAASYTDAYALSNLGDPMAHSQELFDGVRAAGSCCIL